MTERHLYIVIYDKGNDNKIVSVLGLALEKEADERLEKLRKKAVGTNSHFMMDLAYDAHVGMSLDECERPNP